MTTAPPSVHHFPAVTIIQSVDFSAKSLFMPDSAAFRKAMHALKTSPSKIFHVAMVLAIEVILFIHASENQIISK